MPGGPSPFYMVHRRIRERPLIYGILFTALLLTGWVVYVNRAVEAEGGALAAARRAGFQCTREVREGASLEDAHARLVAALLQIDTSSCRPRFRGAFAEYASITERYLQVFTENNPRSAAAILGQSLRKFAVGSSESEKVEAELRTKWDASWQRLLDLKGSWMPL